jgi:signal transduction histidine kinase
VVPLELEQAWVVTAPLGTVRGGLVIVTHEEQATAEAERLVTDLVSLLEARADGLVTRLDRDLAEMRRQRALGDALVQHAEEWRTLVDAIHTTVLQGLASSLYRIELTTRRVDQQPVEQTLLELEQVRDILASHIAALRDAIFRQRPASLEHLGLAAALRDYAANCSARMPWTWTSWGSCGSVLTGTSRNRSSDWFGFWWSGHGCRSVCASW